MADHRDLLRRSTRSARRALVAIGGFVVLAIGIVMMPLPGPGIVIATAGLAILATEFLWARGLLNRARAYARRTAALARERFRQARSNRPGQQPPGGRDRAA